MARKTKVKVQANTTPWWQQEAVIASLLALIVTVGGLVAINKTSLPPTDLKSLITKKPMTNITTPTVFFSTNVFLNRDKTFISLPYKLDKSPQVIWLTLQTSAKDPVIKRLVAHPALDNLTWNYIEDNNIRLYQKNPTYRSMESFIAKPPAAESILADPHLKDDPRFQKLGLNHFIEDTLSLDLNQSDYILTTYKDSRFDKDMLYYETIIDASKARVSDKNQLNWQLETPLASPENNFYLGDIHVDYRQY